MNALQSAGILPLVSRNEFCERLAFTLSLYVGRGKRYTVKQLANGCGVPDRAIECALLSAEHQEFRPLRLEYLWSLISFLGPEFSAELLALAHQGSFHLPEVLTIPAGELAADTAEDAAKLTRAAMGDFENDPNLREIGNRMIVRGAQLVGRGKQIEPDMFQQEQAA